MQKKIYILCFLILCFKIYAQDQDTINKSSVIENIEQYSKKSKFFKSFHKLVFKDRSKKTPSLKANEIIKKINYNTYEGKIIRNIDIQTYDPFGYSITDSTKLPKTQIEKTGNWLHIKTKKFAIRNMLLFKSNQPFDSINIKESERLIRSQRFVRSIRIIPKQLKNNPDSIDLEIKVLDSWSLYPTGTISNTGGTIRLVERNFAGLGHYFSNQYSTRFSNQRHSLRSQYQINNIANTFINLGGIYQIDFKKNYQKSIYADRPFYSPLTKYAGGINATQTYYKDSIPKQFNKHEYLGIKYNSYDFWIGRSFRINNSNNAEITNFITALRYNVINYSESPSFDFDPYRLYTGHQMILGSIAIASNQYKQTKYLFNYEIIEDIGIGKIFSITGGVQWKNQIQRPYIGTKFALGKYINNHFYGIQAEWGSFFNNYKPEQSVFKIDASYFSKAFSVGNWKIRQFINTQLVFGSHRLDYSKDKITLNGRNGIEGFNSFDLRGTKKILLSLQTQTYAPGQILGFRFSPYLATDFGWIGDKYEQFVSNVLYSKFAAGILITNDYLVFQNIQLSIAFYPTIPGVGKNIIRTNNIRNDNFELMRFNDLKPAPVLFQ